MILSNRKAMKISHKLTGVRLGKITDRTEEIYFIGKYKGEDVYVNPKLKWNQ